MIYYVFLMERKTMVYQNAHSLQYATSVDVRLVGSIVMSVCCEVFGGENESGTIRAGACVRFVCPYIRAILNIKPRFQCRHEVKTRSYTHTLVDASSAALYIAICRVAISRNPNIASKKGLPNIRADRVTDEGPPKTFSIVKEYRNLRRCARGNV